jgi:hypothetical protein
MGIGQHFNHPAGHRFASGLSLPGKTVSRKSTKRRANFR